MGLGAIVVIGAEVFRPAGPQECVDGLVLEASLACIDTLGRSMVERSVERFVRAGAETVSVLVPAEMCHAVSPFVQSFENVTVEVVADMRSAITRKCGDYQRDGIEHAFVVSANVYTEADLLDMFYFHREARQTSTQAVDSEGPLDLWVIDCAKAHQVDLAKRPMPGAGVSYFIRDYVSRLTHPRDLRRLVTDALRGHCAMRPSGVELRPGIWVEEGAEIHRRARVVAPAYIGRGSKLREDTLITRFSNIEKGCYIDYGTVIEDSSILANTHIGIWLDVCHAVAKGNQLLSLGRNVTVEILDASIIRAINARDEARNTLDFTYATEPAADSGLRQQKQEQDKKVPAAEQWQFGANPIRG